MPNSATRKRNTKRCHKILQLHAASCMCVADVSPLSRRIQFNSSDVTCAHASLGGPYFVVSPGTPWPSNALASKNQAG